MGCREEQAAWQGGRREQGKRTGLSAGAWVRDARVAAGEGRRASR